MIIAYSEFPYLAIVIIMSPYINATDKLRNWTSNCIQQINKIEFLWILNVLFLFFSTNWLLSLKQFDRYKVKYWNEDKYRLANAHYFYPTSSQRICETKCLCYIFDSQFSLCIHWNVNIKYSVVMGSTCMPTLLWWLRN